MSNNSEDFIYRFSCTCCGDCCTGDMEININLYDLRKIARRLEMTRTGELFRKGLVDLFPARYGVWMPRIRFRKEPFSFCPWQINDLGDDGVLRGFCSLHRDDKPLVCKMAPVSRTVDISDGTESFYITAPTENCPGMEKTEENKLEDLKGELIEELDYETRYYKVLDRFTGEKAGTREEYLSLYDFETERDFEEILTEWEKKHF